MTNLKLIGVGIAGVVVGLLLSASFGGQLLGGVYNQVANHFAQGLYAGTSNQFSVDSSGNITTTGDATISGGSLTVTTSNSATSTVILGCVQTYATSTATAWKLLVVATTTQIAPGYNAVVLAKYGTCPSI